jgi:hypothetical protein
VSERAQHVAYVVSPHGFGHAARSSAVLEALRERCPGVVPHLFTTIPSWFWEDSLGGVYHYHRVLTDVGLVQLSPIEEDAPATLEALAELRPFERAAEPLARAIEEHACELVVCDISPLGLAAAKRCNLPSVLVESFTWDWIYEPYFDGAPGLREVAGEMASLFAATDLHLQAEPFCRPATRAFAVPPVFRRPRASPAEVRRRLSLDGPLVLVTMGGSSAPFDFPLDRLRDAGEIDFVVFAGTAEEERRGNVVLLPDRSPVYLPDLVATAEVVVGKLGYSTVAEAWGAGTRFVYVPRPRFPEGPSLGSFVAEHLPSLKVEEDAFRRGDWLEALPELLSRPRPERRSPSGAVEIAERLSTILGS